LIGIDAARNGDSRAVQTQLKLEQKNWQQLNFSQQLPSQHINIIQLPTQGQKQDISGIRASICRTAETGTRPANK
jgi:hypothetical protein